MIILRSANLSMSAISYPLQSPILRRGMPLSWMNSLLTNRVAYHVVFWSFVFMFNAAYIAFIGEDRDVSLYNLALRIPFILGCCYINLYVLMPRLYYQGKLFNYAILVLGLILSLNAINLYILEFFVDSPICPTTFEADATFNGSNYVYKSFYLFSVVGLTSGIKLSKDNLSTKMRADAIEKEKLQTELSLLKSQVNPHFFFNTLNNLYALTMRKSDDAPAMVLKLSDLMSYSLYESEQALVPLEKEIAHIRNYLDLESVRLASKINISLIVKGEIQDVKVPPLLFLPLIENCFKHSLIKPPGQEIVIALTVGVETICLKTTNPAVEAKKPVPAKGGLGLVNVRRRLELLYSNRFVFDAAFEDGLFIATLEIPKSS